MLPPTRFFLVWDRKFFGSTFAHASPASLKTLTEQQLKLSSSFINFTSLFLQSYINFVSNLFY
jgi:hypothetical protein